MTDVDDFVEELLHYGVKGMKWGVRKKDDSTPSRYRQLRTAENAPRTFKAKNGKTVTVTENPYGPLAAAIGASSGKGFKRYKDSKDFTMTVDGKKVGDASIVSKGDELYLNWLGVRKSQRGQGYGQAVFEGAVQHAKASGHKRITLEVPGNSPDAKHIYEKFGFKSTGVIDGGDGDLWGGLENMVYDIP